MYLFFYSTRQIQSVLPLKKITPFRAMFGGGEGGIIS
jgi:hypothetical protein